MVPTLFFYELGLIALVWLFLMLWVAYLLAADNVSRLLPSRLRGVNQLVIRTLNGCSSPRPRLLACL
jgi:hypothetical protein